MNKNIENIDLIIPLPEDTPDNIISEIKERVSLTNLLVSNSSKITDIDIFPFKILNGNIYGYVYKIEKLNLFIKLFNKNLYYLLPPGSYPKFIFNSNNEISHIQIIKRG